MRPLRHTVSDISSSGLSIFKYLSHCGGDAFSTTDLSTFYLSFLAITGILWDYVVNKLPLMSKKTQFQIRLIDDTNYANHKSNVCFFYRNILSSLLNYYLPSLFSVFLDLYWNYAIMIIVAF